MREAEVASAQAQLIGFDDHGLSAAIGAGADDIPIRAPATGRVLRVMQQSETTLPVGAPIMEIGNIESDLEVVVELLSSDLAGVVERVDPFGVAKFSALGVEEQRVTAVIRFAGPPEAHAGLGHGFRVETRIVVWEAANAVIVPASALFRSRGEWAVFLVEGGVARLVQISLGRNNGTDAQVLDGLSPGVAVVLYPSSGLVDGVSVARRRVQ